MPTWVTRACSYRAATEDRVHVERRGFGLLVVVADGAGGRGGGARAADLAVSHALERLDADDPCRIARLMGDLDAAIVDDPEAGETTLVVTVISGGHVSGASTGDSSGWMLGADGIVELTEDQHRKRRLGSGAATPVPFRSVLRTPARVLVGTDGLSSYVSATDLTRIAAVTDLHEAADELVARARTSAGTLRDDLALALVDLA